jgi:mono/diheme cytochrome c family protein
VLVLLVAVAGVYIWASLAASRALSTPVDVHSVDFPVPPPLEPSEIASLGLDEAAARQLAQERAVERGRHLVMARYACVECHGQNFGGGVMVDAFPLGRFLGPNLTTGEGSRTRDYQPHDWDRIVRHGVLPDGRPAVMPSEDFQRMSDQELADIVAYIRSIVDVTVTGTPRLETDGDLTFGGAVAAEAGIIGIEGRLDSPKIGFDLAGPACGTTCSASSLRSRD